MCHHGVEHLVVADVGASEAELGGERLLGAQAVARADAGALVKPLQLVAAGRGLQIFVDGDGGARGADNLQRLARSPAQRIVVDGDFHSVSTGTFLANTSGLPRKASCGKSSVAHNGSSPNRASPSIDPRK